MSSDFMSILQYLIPEECHTNVSLILSSYGDINSTRNSQVWAYDNPHRTVESNFQHPFSVHMWCGIVGDQLTDQYIFSQDLTGDIYTRFLQNKLPALLVNVPLHTQLQMYYQHDGVPPHFTRNIMQYLTEQFPNHWIGHGGPENWPL
jgi:hypothetical protein